VSLEDPARVEGEALWTNNGTRDLPPPLLRGSQKVWEGPDIQDKIQALIDEAPSREDKARLLAVQKPEANSWLNAVPSPPLGTWLTDEQMRTSTALRLGSDICVPHKCHCGTQVSAKGHHGLHCLKSKGRFPRHASLNEVLARALRSAGIPCTLEPPGMSRSDKKRPDGKTFVPWSRGKPLAWDATCWDTFAPSHVTHTSTAAGAAAATAEVQKHRRYEFLEDRYIFVPVAVESMGCMGEEGLDLVKKIGSLIRRRHNFHLATAYLFQRLSIAIQQGNTAAILGTLPPGKQLDEIFFF